MLITLGFAIALYPLLEPARAAGSVAPNSKSIESLTAFGHSFPSKRGVYYVVSPEVIGAPTSGPFHWNHSYIVIDRRQIELGRDYVILYGRNETLTGRLELAKENMEVIRGHLSGSFYKHAADTIQVGGESTIGNLAKTASALCDLQVTYGRNASALTLVTSGARVSAKQLCVGLGVVAALGGYRIMPTKQGLELRREFHVEQAAAIESEHALGSPRSNDPTSTQKTS